MESSSVAPAAEPQQAAEPTAAAAKRRPRQPKADSAASPPARRSRPRAAAGKQTAQAAETMAEAVTPPEATVAAVKQRSPQPKTPAAALHPPPRPPEPATEVSGHVQRLAEQANAVSRQRKHLPQPEQAVAESSEQSSEVIEPAEATPAELPAAKPRRKMTSKTPTPRKRKPSSPGKKKRAKKRKNTVPLRHRLMFLGFEAVGLSAVLLVGVMTLLGYAADRFSGTGFFSNLLPFAAGVLGFIVMSALFLVGWWKLRAWLNGKTTWLSPALSVCLAVAIGWFVAQESFAQAYRYFRTLVGATAEAERATIAHQVYAAYRRTGPAQLQQLIDRGRNFAPAIQEAAQAFNLDRDLLYGLAAAESSFLPRDSKDGGHGLFQITQVPQQASALALQRLGSRTFDLRDARHNAFLAAATLHYYLDEMRGDLFLGLLAYNIGPKNGGLLFIMQQYGAKDFITIQPYLQTLPRDYPIRVLSYALAFRLWQRDGKLPAYEEGNNAVHIQEVGIPGIEMEI